ncbi:hypothetical protein ANRL2_00536 [Anaerolineae bacterium]|nr:hypothetical protein ANRL2_00536 [Anaerolineae bacterium]
MSTKPAEIVIRREDAVFRLDRRGRWCNEFGVFRNHRISEYFHSAIRRDAGGYFVCQERESLTEKVYFPYEDTALFVMDLTLGPAITLRLNTRRQTELDPAQLFVAGDSLYLMAGDERIKFTERALMKLAEVMDFTSEGYFIRMGGRLYRIRENSGGET